MPDDLRIIKTRKKLKVMFTAETMVIVTREILTFLTALRMPFVTIRI